MPNVTTVGTSGGNKEVVSVTVGTSGGNKAVISGHIGTASGNRVFFASLSASASPASISASGISINITTEACTISASAGLGPYTYNWTQVSGGAITIGSPSSASTTFTASGLSAGTGRSGVFRCTVIDTATDAEATVDVTVDIERLP